MGNEKEEEAMIDVLLWAGVAVGTAIGALVFCAVLAVQLPDIHIVAPDIPSEQLEEMARKEA